MAPAAPPGRLALLVGGGPAPGINGVISSVTIEAIEQGIEVIGFQDGFKWLVKGDADHYRKLLIDDVKAIHLRGGSILGTSRTNPAKSDERHAQRARRAAQAQRDHAGDHRRRRHGLLRQPGLRCGPAAPIRVAHVPKTIDNDLPLPGSTPTFGFETARHVGVGIVRNLAEDARTTSRWYLIVSMGRAAGHLALGIGKAAAATLTIIPEEFRGRQVTPRRGVRHPHRPHHQAPQRQHPLRRRRAGRGADRGHRRRRALETMIDDGQLGRYGTISRDRTATCAWARSSSAA